MANKHLQTSIKEKILLRRARITELYGKGNSQVRMAEILNIPRSTIGQDLRIMRAQARTDLSSFFDEKLPYEHKSLLNSTDLLSRKAWSILEDENATDKAIGNAMHIILQCIQTKRELLGDMSDITMIVENLKSMATTNRRDLITNPQSINNAIQSKNPRGQAIF